LICFCYSQTNRFRTCWQRDKKTREIQLKVRVNVVRGWCECGGGGGGWTAAAVKSMEQPRRRNASRLRVACSRRRDVYRFRRRYRRHDASEPVTTTKLLSLCRRFSITLLFRKRTSSPFAAVYKVYVLITGGRAPGLTQPPLYLVIIYY